MIATVVTDVVVKATNLMLLAITVAKPAIWLENVTAPETPKTEDMVQDHQETPVAAKIMLATIVEKKATELMSAIKLTPATRAIKDTTQDPLNHAPDLMMVATNAARKVTGLMSAKAPKELTPDTLPDHQTEEPIAVATIVENLAIVLENVTNPRKKEPILTQDLLKLVVAKRKAASSAERPAIGLRNALPLATKREVMVSKGCV
jgi:hypothetical protein